MRMDDGLVLNLVGDDNFATKRAPVVHRGGKWTDRLKVKRTAKRKVSTCEKPSREHLEDSNPRPAKKARNDPTPSSSKPAPKPLALALSASKPQTQVISSLFTSNPKVEAVEPSVKRPVGKPSNAPISSSTFEGLGLNPLLIAHLSTKLQISKPTAIQRASLPLMLADTSNEDLRDVFIQSQTGSGKTLSYVLPIIQDLLPLSSLSYIDRSIGTLAIIIAPTRELAKQIHDVVEALLKMRLRAENDTDGDSKNSTRMTRWLVSGLLIGGSTRTHEKARLRKGCPILVSTPGRLLDHIQNTSSFNVGKCRWLVLDEADQLMELGFEETITGILKGMDGRRRLAIQAVQEGKSMEVGGWDWERRRRTVLCSATLRDSVQSLVGTALVDPIMIKALEDDKEDQSMFDRLVTADTPTSQQLTPPSQLSQKYVVVPLKLRLVALVALLRTLIAQGTGGTKIIVFLSCTDSVDFHWTMLGGATMGESTEEPQTAEGSKEDGADPDKATKKEKKTPGDPDSVEINCALIPSASIFRLHGSLPTAVRMRALMGFAGSKGKHAANQENSPSILLCTSVASRGLDLPLVRAVVQYDLPTEGGPNEYIHRVGRTARAGKGGEAWSMVAPSECDWVKWIEERIQGDGVEKSKKSDVTLGGVSIESVLQSGFGGRGREYESRATEAQMAFERWVLKNSDHTTLARKAYQSHMRAYATHPSNEKHIFHIRHLHLGHLAKSFALREAPAKVNAAYTSKSTGKGPKAKTAKFKRVPGASKAKPSKRHYHSDSDGPEEGHDADAEQRMKAVVRAQGRLTKKGGAMFSSGASEFQIMSSELEKIVQL